MPLSLIVEKKELYDEASNRFIEIPEKTILLEHSLISISKWEARWHKAYLNDRTPKKKEEQIDYVRCMTLSKNVDPYIYYGLSNKNWKEINDYINDPMTETTFTKMEHKRSKDIITNELIYYWMASLQIPFDPCEKWHLNHLLTLIEVAGRKNKPPKKMSPKAIASQNKSLNAARRAALHSSG